MVNNHELIHDAVSIGPDRRVDISTVPAETLEAFEEFNDYYRKNDADFWEAVLRSQKWEDEYRTPVMLIRQPGDSKREVIVTQPPFGTNVFTQLGNPNSFNTAVKNFLLNHINRSLGMTDWDGNYISTMVIGAADRDYAPNFTLKEHWELAHGDFSPYALRILKIMKQFGYECGYYYGYSRASAVGGAVLRNAAGQDVDILGAVLAEPTDFIKQSVPQFIKSYLANYAPGQKPDELTGQWWDDGPDVMLELQREYGDGSYIGNFRRPSVLSSVRGMAQDRLRSDIKDALDREKMVVLPYGENSGVAHRTGEIVVADNDLPKFARSGLLHVVKVGGEASGHDWGENHLAHASVFSDGLLYIN